MGGDAALKKIYDRRLPVSFRVEPGDLFSPIERMTGITYVFYFRNRQNMVTRTLERTFQVRIVSIFPLVRLNMC